MSDGPNVAALRFREITRPLRTTFTTSLGTKKFLRNILISIVLDDGSSGMGEIPTSFSHKHETAQAIKKVLGEARRIISGAPAGEHASLAAQLRRRFPSARMTASGIEVALLRAHLMSTGRSEREFFGSSSTALETDITIPFLPDKDALARWIGYAALKGFKTFKVKVSGKLDEDKRFLALVRELICKHMGAFTLRLDGNQGFGVKSSLQLLDYTQKDNYPVELLEQPLPRDDLKGMHRLVAESRVPIIADESVESLSDAQRVIDEGACHGINVKLAKTGIEETLAIIRLARKHKLTLMAGCMTETMVGLSAALYLTAGSGYFAYVDLDSVHLLRHSKQYGDILIQGPFYRFTGRAQDRGIT